MPGRQIIPAYNTQQATSWPGASTPPVHRPAYTPTQVPATSFNAPPRRPTAVPTAASAWEEYFTDDGTPYYYHPTTGVTTWEKPEPAASPSPSIPIPARVANNNDPLSRSMPNLTYNPTPGAAPIPVASPHLAQPQRGEKEVKLDKWGDARMSIGDGNLRLVLYLMM